jgi:hypothetical protein
MRAAVEEAYFRKTGIFPIMHVVALRRSLHEQHPWLAMNLYKAFDEAKSRSVARASDITASFYPLPWTAQIAQASRELFGADIWPYGIEPNRVTLDAFLQYAFEQGVCHRRLAPEDLFPEEVSRALQGVGPRVAATRAAPHAISPTRAACAAAAPHGRFFSAAITAASASIQPMLPMPTTNITSISAQQQPTQKTAVIDGRCGTLRAPARARASAIVTNVNGVRHCSRQRYLSALNWKTPAPISTADAISAPCSMNQSERAANGAQRRIRAMRDEPEREPRAEESRDDARDQSAFVGAAAHDAPEQRDQRQHGGQHHGGDHQDPRERVQQRGHDDLALRAARGQARRRAGRPPSRDAPHSVHTGSPPTARASPTPRPTARRSARSRRRAGRGAPRKR